MLVKKKVQRGSFIKDYGIGQGEGIEKFKSKMLNIYSGNFPVPKDDDISTVDHVLRYYETINLDIEGSKEILKTFDRVDRGFNVPSPSPEVIAAATAETEGVSNVVPSGAAGDLVQELDKIIAREEGEVGEVGQVGEGPVPSPAPVAQPREPVPSPAPIPQPQEPVPPQGPRPQPGEEIQGNISMLYINYNEYSQNTTKELKIAKDNLEKLNEELFKPPDCHG